MSVPAGRVADMTEPLDPDEFEELKRRVSRLRVDEAETRWLALHLDQDVQALAENIKNLRGDVGSLADVVGTVAQTVSSVSERLDRVDARTHEHFEKIETKLAAHDDHFDKIETELMAHGGRFDSVDAQLRSLTALVGQALQHRDDDAGEPQS